MDLSIVIVSYNTKDKLQMCLRSVFDSQTGRQFEVFVVDNASKDGSSEMVADRYPQVKLLRNAQNLGFSKANNQAIRLAKGRYVLLLNSDVEVSRDTFDKTVSFMDNNPAAGICGCRVVKTDGTLDLACRRSFPTPWNALFRFTGLSLLFPKSRLAVYNLTYLSDFETVEVDSVMGAYLFIRKEAIERIGLLDETFFMYGEDIDWCFRAKEAGYKVMYAPVSTVIHHKGSSSRKASIRSLYEFHRAMQIFYDKHYRKKYGMLISGAVRIGIWGRFLWKRLQNSFRREKYVSK